MSKNSKMPPEKLAELDKFWRDRFQPSVQRTGAKPKRSAVRSANVWRTKDGQEIPFRELTNAHLAAIARMLRKQPTMRKANLIRKELVRRGMQAHLRPSYPEL